MRHQGRAAEARNGEVDEADESVGGVEVAGAVVALEVGAVLRELPAVLRHFVQVMAPGVAELRGQTVRVADAEDGLQRVVVGGTDAFDLVDIAILRVGRDVRAFENTGVGCSAEENVRGGAAKGRLIDVEKAEQPATLAADVANLEECLRTERLLKLEVVVEVVRSAEVAIHRKDAARI